MRLIFTIARLTVLEMLRRRLFLVLLGLTLLVVAFTSWGFGQITTNGGQPMTRVQQVAVVSQLLILVGFMFSFTLAFSAVFAGARGFLVKEIGGDALVTAVRAVAAGQSILDPGATRAVAEKMKGLAGSHAKERAAESLSSQEKRVLALVAEGKMNKEIAAALGLSDKTVKNYLATIFQKLQVGRRAHAAAIYLQSKPE